MRIQKGKELITMLEMIYAIPEPIGWALVGYLAAWATILGWKVGKTLYLAIKDRLANDEEEDF
jgi:hypothetical protein